MVPIFHTQVGKMETSNLDLIHNCHALMRALEGKLSHGLFDLKIDLMAITPSHTLEPGFIGDDLLIHRNALDIYLSPSYGES